MVSKQAESFNGLRREEKFVMRQSAQVNGNMLFSRKNSISKLFLNTAKWIFKRQTPPKTENSYLIYFNNPILSFKERLERQNGREQYSLAYIYSFTLFPRM